MLSSLKSAISVLLYEAKAKQLDVVVTSAKQIKDAADQDLKDLEESIAKLKKIIAKLLELAK